MQLLKKYIFIFLSIVLATPFALQAAEEAAAEPRCIPRQLGSIMKTAPLFKLTHDGHSSFLLGSCHVVPLADLPRDVLQLISNHGELITEIIFDKSLVETVLSDLASEKATQSEVWSALSSPNKEKLLKFFLQAIGQTTDEIALFFSKKPVEQFQLSDKNLNTIISALAFTGGMDHELMAQAESRKITISALENEDIRRDCGVDLEAVQKQYIPQLDMTWLTVLENHLAAASSRKEFTHLLLNKVKSAIPMVKAYQEGRCFFANGVDKLVPSSILRNRIWVPKILEFNRKSQPEALTLMVFGAFHLLGPQGVLERLKHQGAQVEMYDGKTKNFVKIPDVYLHPYIFDPDFHERRIGEFMEKACELMKTVYAEEDVKEEQESKHTDLYKRGEKIEGWFGKIITAENGHCSYIFETDDFWNFLSAAVKKKSPQDAVEQILNPLSAINLKILAGYADASLATLKLQKADGIFKHLKAGGQVTLTIQNFSLHKQDACIASLKSLVNEYETELLYRTVNDKTPYLEAGSFIEICQQLSLHKSSIYKPIKSFLLDMIPFAVELSHRDIATSALSTFEEYDEINEEDSHTLLAQYKLNLIEFMTACKLRLDSSEITAEGHVLRFTKLDHLQPKLP